MLSSRCFVVFPAVDAYLDEWTSSLYLWHLVTSTDSQASVLPSLFSCCATLSVKLHHDSLAILPLLTLDNKTIRNLDNTYHILDGEITDQIQELYQQVDHLTLATVSTLTNFLTYVAFAWSLFHCLLFVLSYFFIFDNFFFLPPLVATSPLPAKGHPLPLNNLYVKLTRFDYTFFLSLSLCSFIISTCPHYSLFRSPLLFPLFSPITFFPINFRVSPLAIHFADSHSTPRLLSTMDLRLIVELDGFQYGPDPSVLKRIVLQPLHASPNGIFAFQTDFLLHDPIQAQQTYCYAARYIHGLTRALPGLPYDSLA